MTAALAIHASRRVISLERLIQRVADRFGVPTATAWTQAILRHQGTLDLAALRAALVSRNLDRLAAVVRATQMQQLVQRAVSRPLLGATMTAARRSTELLQARGLAGGFDVLQVNVIEFARRQAADLVVGIPQQTKQVIAEVVAIGQRDGLSIDQMARAIREVVGLPPHWAPAPLRFGDELRAAAETGHLGTLTRRLSGADMVQIRARLAAGTLDEAFIQRMQETYAARLVSYRARSIARTEAIRSSNWGVGESWRQAQRDGFLPHSARRFWLVAEDERACPICIRIPGMNRAGRPLDEPFMTPVGPVMYPPEPHPQCRCTITLHARRAA